MLVVPNPELPPIFDALLQQIAYEEKNVVSLIFVNGDSRKIQLVFSFVFCLKCEISNSMSALGIEYLGVIDAKSAQRKFSPDNRETRTAYKELNGGEYSLYEIYFSSDPSLFVVCKNLTWRYLE